MRLFIVSLSGVIPFLYPTELSYARKLSQSNENVIGNA
jgi:hypothetical protein